MKFTLKLIEGHAGALFGTIRNNVQLNLSSIDGTIKGDNAMSGTLFGYVARDKDHPIRVDMVESRYCILGNIKDTCLPDPKYKADDDDFDAGKNDQGTDDGQEIESLAADSAQTQGDCSPDSDKPPKKDPCCENITDPPEQ